MMDYEQANKALLSFSGYSSALPPIINSEILTLFRGVSVPDRPMRGPERSGLEQNCELSLSVLHQFTLNSPHESAVALLRAAVRDETQFALYLRNFDLGALPAGPRIPVEVLQDHVVIQQDFVVKMQDDEFQSSLREHVTPKLPVIAVENAVFEFHRDSCLPRLSLPGSAWENVVSRLVGSAAIIIVFVDSLTPGLSAELAMIRAAHRQLSTIVVFANDDLPNTTFDDLPIIATWDISHASQLLSDAMARVYPLQGALRLDLAGLTLTRPRPPEHVKRAADTLIRLAFSSAGHEIQVNGSVDEAIDNLIAAIAASFWSDNVAARGVAYKRLAMAQHQERKLYLASSNLQRFLDLVERSESTGADLPPVLFGLEDLVHKLEQSKDDPRICRLVARFVALQRLAGM
jgi:hypothetical protein